jgi:hypothetical protein
MGRVRGVARPGPKSEPASAAQRIAKYLDVMYVETYPPPEEDRPGIGGQSRCSRNGT